VRLQQCFQQVHTQTVTVPTLMIGTGGGGVQLPVLHPYMQVSKSSGGASARQVLSKQDAAQDAADLTPSGILQLRRVFKISGRAKRSVEISAAQSLRIKLEVQWHPWK
jgi:hypothetical protein